jgi:hypothetical protein
MAAQETKLRMQQLCSKAQRCHGEEPQATLQSPAFGPAQG